MRKLPRRLFQHNLMSIVNDWDNNHEPMGTDLPQYFRYARQQAERMGVPITGIAIDTHLPFSPVKPRIAPCENLVGGDGCRTTGCSLDRERHRKWISGTACAGKRNVKPCWNGCRLKFGINRGMATYVPAIHIPYWAIVVLGSIVAVTTVIIKHN